MIIVFSPVVAYIGFIFGMGHYLKNQRQETRIEMMKTKFECPEGCDKKIEPWGGWDRAGIMRFCMKDNKRHGKIEIWAKQKLRTEGYYINGKESGVWKYYDNNGKVRKTISYK